MSHWLAGTPQPGARQVRFPQRTNSANLAEGTYPGLSDIASMVALLGHQVQDDVSGGDLATSRAVGLATLAAQPLCPGGQGTHGVRTPLLLGIRIGIADRGRERIQPLLEGVPVSGEDIGAHCGQPVLGINDDHLTVLDALLATAHRILIGLGDNPVDLAAQLAL